MTPMASDKSAQIRENGVSWVMSVILAKSLDRNSIVHLLDAGSGWQRRFSRR